jgi:hypothetical protein
MLLSQGRIGEPLVASYTPQPRPARETGSRTPRPLVYAVPVLLALSVVAVLDTTRPSDGPDAGAVVADPAAVTGRIPAVSNPGGPSVQADGAPTYRPRDVP